MQRYFLNNEISETFTLTSDADAFQHFGRVLRAKIGSQAEFVTPSQKVIYIAEVETLDRHEMVLRVIDEKDAGDIELPISIDLIVSPLKNDRSDWLVQKATELGANRIIFTKMTRTVANWDRQLPKKQQRLQKIAQAAAEQSHRLKIPEIVFMSWQDTLKVPKDAGIVAWEESARHNEHAALVSVVNHHQHGRLAMLFGPEGGLTENEIQDLSHHDFLSAGLGPRILRAETAPLYALSAVSLLCELV